MIAGLLLAAGRSARFGTDKLCAKLRGKAVIRWSAQALVPSVEVAYVVIPPGADAVVQALSRLDVRVVVNLARDEGMASSIRAGVEAMPPDVEAVIIALGDQPTVDAGVVTDLIRRWQTGDVDAVVPMYRDGRGHPVLFGRSCFEALRALRGDVGARAVLESLGDRVASVDVSTAMPIDVDTPEMLAALEETAR